MLERKVPYMKRSIALLIVLMFCLGGAYADTRDSWAIQSYAPRWALRSYVPTEEELFEDFGSFTYLSTDSYDGRYRAELNIERREGDLATTVYVYITDTQSGKTTAVIRTDRAYDFWGTHQTDASITLSSKGGNTTKTTTEKLAQVVPVAMNGKAASVIGSKLSEVAIPASAIQTEAVNNDVAVVVFGRNAGEFADRKQMDDFELTQVERELLQNVSTSFRAKGKKVIVVLNIGGVIETSSWKGLADAILLPWSPGQEGANAIADVITGKTNPSGKLPMTFPVNFIDHPSSSNFPYNYTSQQSRSGGFGGFGRRTAQKDIDYTDYAEGIWVGYRHFVTRGVEVSYPFGFGMSYTTFRYSKPVVKAVQGGFEASVTVTNTGAVAGKEVVEVYVHAPEDGLEKPDRELKAFTKTKLLAPGESQTVTVKVDNYTIASFNEAANEWQAPAGNYQVMFGASVCDIRAEAPYKMRKAESWPVLAAFKLNAD